ncbi:MAG: uracil-DNA glycosylase family protein [Paludibacteraceae bacterium]|nr:uracil-DNA glycosylase family protein [Paludibacteraceae bacterium]
MANLLVTPNLNNAKISYPTVSMICNFLQQQKQNNNQPLFCPNNLNFKIANITGNLTNKNTRGGFHFEQGSIKTHPLNNGKLWGIDIPILIENQTNQANPNKNLLIIIGQDPLRKCSDKYLISLAGSTFTPMTNYTIIGTPYAVTAHLNPLTLGTEPYGKSQIYYQLIDDTLNLVKKTSNYDKKADYDVYLTDVIKYYPSNEKDPDSSDLQLLADEIKFFWNSSSYGKVVILAHGNKAISAINKCSLTTSSTRKIIKTPHISGTANRAWSKWFSNQSSKYTPLSNGFANMVVSNANKVKCIISLL